MRNKFKTYGPRAALIYQDQTTTYGELVSKIDHYAHQLQQLQLPAHQPVALLCHSDPDVIALMLALLAHRSIVICFPDTPRNPECLLDTAEATSQLVLNQGKVSLLPQEARPLNPLYQTLKTANAPGLVLFSSGSSGQPKAIVHNADTLLAKFATPKPALRTLMFLSFDHIGGLNTIFYTLAGGSTLVIPEDRSPQAICQAIQSHQVELLPTTPSFLNLLLMSELYRTYDLSTLKIISYGTELMPPATLEKLSSLFPQVKLKQTFGMSEIGILPSISPENNTTRIKIGDSQYQIKVIDHVLWIKSPASMLGYLNTPSPFDQEGWFCTRDLVELDGEYLRFLGRASEIINVGGLKIYPAEIENILLQMPQIQDVVVSKAPNPILGQIVVATIMASDPEASPLDLKEQIIRFCQDKLEAYKIPQKVIITTDSMVSERYKKIRSLQIKTPA